MNEISIRKATKNDLTTILNIANSLIIDSSIDDSQAESEGFLVSRFELSDYQKYFSETEYLYIAETEGEVTGFLLAYTSESIDCSEVVNYLLKYNLVDPFILIKQIAVLKQQSGKGVASSLYRHIFSKVSDRNFVAAIVTEPLNERSIKFHEKHSFNHLLDIVPPPDPDGELRNRAIWFRNSDGQNNKLADMRITLPDREADITQLIENQHDAIVLYNHEDNLNWTKFGMHVTFMMAMFAAFSYLLERDSGIINLIMCLITIVFGFMINYIFAEKIKSGLMYMQSHKEKVKRVESRLKWLNPLLVSLINTSNIKISGTSKTVSLMQWIPGLSYVLWSFSSLALLLKELGRF